MRKIRILESILLQNRNWLCEADFVYTILWLVRISLLIRAITESFAFFSGKLFYKSNRKLFFLCLPSLNTRAVKRILITLSRIIPTPLAFISGYANTENVFYCLSLTLSLRLIYCNTLKFQDEPCLRIGQLNPRYCFDVMLMFPNWCP